VDRIYINRSGRVKLGAKLLKAFIPHAAIKRPPTVATDRGYQYV
jgi:hypothetical protein